MAVVSPKALIPASAITSTPTVYASNGSGTTFGIIRSILATATAGGLTFTMSLGADAAGTRVIAAVALTANSPYNPGGMWIVTPTNSAHAIDATGTGTGTQMIATIGGYESV